MAGRRTLRMRAPTHTQNRACAVGQLQTAAPVRVSMAAERKTKLSKNLLRMKVRGRGEAGRAVGMPSLSDLAGAEAAGVQGIREAEDIQLSGSFIHWSSACSALGTGNWIINFGGFSLKTGGRIGETDA